MRIVPSAPMHFCINVHSLKSVRVPSLFRAWPDSLGAARRCFASRPFPASPPRAVGPVHHCPMIKTSLLSACVQSATLPLCAFNFRFIHQSRSFQGIDSQYKPPPAHVSPKTQPLLERSDPDPELQGTSAVRPESNYSRSLGGAQLPSISKWSTLDAALTSLIGLCVGEPLPHSAS